MWPYEKDVLEEKIGHPETERFWMIYSPEGGQPTRQHYRYEEALEEAQRLAKKHTTRRFYILESQQLVRVQTPVEIINMEVNE